MIHILSPGFFTTLQDLGRPAAESFGVPQGGAMDRFALMAANALVGNPLGTAGLEFTLAGPALWLEQDGLAALTGCGFELWVDGRLIPPWMAAWVRRGEVVELRATGRGGWGTLALAGGVEAAAVLGSRSTYVKGGLGGLEGRALRAGDSLGVGFGAYSRIDALRNRAGLSLPPERRPLYSESPVIEVIVGMQADRFEGIGGLGVFLNNEYTLTPACDRMGYRLQGPPVTQTGKADILSEGIAQGAVQIPGDGQPIVLMADRQTTGGYTKIAAATSASLPELVQALVGGKVRFKAVTVETAQNKWRALIGGLQ